MLQVAATYLLALAEESWRRGVVSDVSPLWAPLNEVPLPFNLMSITQHFSHIERLMGPPLRAETRLTALK